MVYKGFMRSRQPTFPFNEFKRCLDHGGEIRKGKRKGRRPVVTKRAMHVVFRSTRARGKFSLLHKRNVAVVRDELLKWSKYFGVRIYQWANVGNHIHLLIRARTRGGFQNFLRTFSGKVAQRVTGAKRGRGFGRFWDLLTYSRVVEWGKAFRIVREYVLQNELEGLGILSVQVRKVGGS